MDVVRSIKRDSLMAVRRPARRDRTSPLRAMDLRQGRQALDRPARSAAAEVTAGQKNAPPAEASGAKSREEKPKRAGGRAATTITDRSRLFDEFADIRKTGIACDREESIMGGICYSAAIRPAGKQVIAAISLSTPVVRMTPERDAETRKAVLEAAVRLSES